MCVSHDFHLWRIEMLNLSYCHCLERTMCINVHSFFYFHEAIRKKFFFSYNLWISIIWRWKILSLFIMLTTIVWKEWTWMRQKTSFMFITSYEKALTFNLKRVFISRLTNRRIETQTFLKNAHDKISMIIVNQFSFFDCFLELKLMFNLFSIDMRDCDVLSMWRNSM